MTEPNRAELTWAFREATKRGIDIHTLMGACASVGIEHGKSATEMAFIWALGWCGWSEEEYRAQVAEKLRER